MQDLVNVTPHLLLMLGIVIYSEMMGTYTHGSFLRLYAF